MNPLKSGSIGCNGVEALVRTMTAVILLAASSVQAQGAFDGQWTLGWSSDRNSAEEAVLVIIGKEGTFQRQARARNNRNPCVGREMPIELTQSAEAEATVQVFGSRVLSGCPDFTIQLKKSGDDSLVATFSSRGSAEGSRKK